MKVMIVDDEKSIRILVKTIMEEAGYQCISCENAGQALACIEKDKPDVVILDVMMPKVDGFELCRQIREIDDSLPVLFLSAKGDIVDKKVGFSSGADDYLVKPFDEEELIIRVEALHRRSQRKRSGIPNATEGLVIGSFRFDGLRHRVSLNNDEIPLTPKEFQLLYQLASHHGKVMSKEELIESVWGHEYINDSINLAVYMRKIREKIEQNPAKPVYLKNIWSVGYIFEP